MVSYRPKLLVVSAFLDLQILLCIYMYIMTRCIAKPMNLEKPKRILIWDGGSIILLGKSPYFRTITFEMFGFCRMKNFMPKRKRQFRTAWKIKACIHLYPQLVNFEKRSQQKNNSGFYLPLGAKPICHQTGDYCYFLSEKFMENEEHEENGTSVAIEVYRQLALIRYTCLIL